MRSESTAKSEKFSISLPPEQAAFVNEETAAHGRKTSQTFQLAVAAMMAAVRPAKKKAARV